MGASRASTAAGRRRAASRRGGSAPPRKPAAKAPARKPVRKPAPAKSSARKTTARTTKPAGRRPARGVARATPRQTRSKPTAPRMRIPRPRLPRLSFGGFFRGIGSAVGSLARVRVLIGIVAALGVLAVAYQLVLRDLPLFSVDEVSVTGVEGPEAGPVTAALEKAAGDMTTLHVDQGALTGAVAGYPTVVGVTTHTDFPHGLTIHVNERPPVLMAHEKGEEGGVPVAGDGTILAGVDLGEAQLPWIEVEDLPAKGALTGEGLAMATIAGAAPAELRDLVRGVAYDKEDGVEVELKGGIPLRFGTPERAADKWAAAAAVLADPKIDTMTYLDLRVPERPAVGGAAPPPSAPVVP